MTSLNVAFVKSPVQSYFKHYNLIIGGIVVLSLYSVSTGTKPVKGGMKAYIQFVLVYHDIDLIWTHGRLLELFQVVYHVPNRGQPHSGTKFVIGCL